MRTSAEPYRAKIVEQIHLSTRAEREQWIKEADYNLFRLRSRQVTIDLLTDSGTGAMSDNQWAGMFVGDEAYAGSVNFEHFKETVTKLFGFEHVIPTHQGRGAENLLFRHLAAKGRLVVGNTHFDTTRAHIEQNGLQAVDLPVAEAANPDSHHPFKGDTDVDALARLLDEKAADVACIVVTVTNNAVGGQPVSLANLQAVRDVARAHDVPLFLDGARFAENAFFIREREAAYRDKSLPEIVRAMADCADGCLVSAKKDGLVNIGGFAAVRDEELYRELVPAAVAYEGFLTYGGLAGRDVEAMARGLQEVMEPAYLAERIGQVAALGEKLAAAGVPVVQPFGGHAVYIDAGRALPHVPPAAFPGQALAVQLYIEGGVRGVEVGTVMAGRDPETGAHNHPSLELVRLAIPRRVYSDEHMEYVAEMVQHVWQQRADIRGLKFVEEPSVLRHFTAKFAVVD